jgi:hypothetical protein
VNEPDSVSYSLRVVNNMLDDLDRETSQRFGEDDGPDEDRGLFAVLVERRASLARAFAGGLITGSVLVLAGFAVCGWLWKRSLDATWEDA